MQNEFEKQVQQKMEELKLVPSDPVWQKVEMQIRKKKDRRRLIFWLPLMVLLLSGALWVGFDQYSNNYSYTKSNSEKINQPLQKQNGIDEPKEQKEQTTNESQETNLKLTVPLVPGNKTFSTVHAGENKISGKAAILKEAPKGTGLEKEILSPKQKEEPVAKKDENVFLEKQTKDLEKTIGSPELNQQIEQKQSSTDSTLSLSNQTPDSVSTGETSQENNVTRIDSTKNDSSLMQLPGIKRHAQSKWRLAFAVTGGRSGSGRLNIFKGLLGGAKSMDFTAAPSSGPGGTVNYPPSEVEKGFSFSVGAELKKQLTKRTSFSTGLHYNYYNNSIQVGNKIARDTTISSYSVREYFLNSNSNFGSNAALQSYTNRYHFLSIPFIMEWQLLKKHPLNLHTGLSLQYLLQTNGLIFDYTKQAYFHNKNALHHIQLFSDLGLSYSFPLKKSSIAVGPELQYSLSRLEKNNSDYHLYRFGLKAQLKLQ